MFYKDIKHQVTRRRQATNARLTEGKEPFSFALYRKLARSMLRQEHKDSIFSRLFLVLSWNLVCRAANTEAIRLAHIGWQEDALAVMFSHMKNDQEGERPGDARHVYANPVMPEICPILALAIYYSTFGFAPDGKLFPGKNQYDRYSKALKREMTEDDVAAELSGAGLTTAHFGSHSARKGAATFVSSCITSGPSAASICLRAGWSLPGVQNTYIRYEAAGDMVVGRFVAGLPFERPEFAIQPPFFMETTAVVSSALALCFPGALASFRNVGLFCLASLAYHATFLRQNLPPRHIPFDTPLFRDASLYEQVRALVFCRNYEMNDPVRPTGIPPHIGLIVTLSECKKSIESIIPTMAAQMRTVLDEQHTHAGCSVVSMKTALFGILQKHGILPSQPQPVESAATQEPSVAFPIHTWGGAIHRVPNDFVFPPVTLSIMWQLWCVGDTNKGVPPFRLLSASDMSSKSACTSFGR